MPLLVSGLRIPMAMSNCCLDLVKLKTLKYIMALGRCLWIHHSTSYPKLFLLQENSPCTHLMYIALYELLIAKLFQE